MFYGFVITEAGNRLLAKMVAGETLKMTRVVMDKGTAESAEAARKLTAPINPGPDGTSTVPVLDGNTVNMIVEYRSDLGDGLKEGFWIGGFAMYAEDPATGDDVMIYYGSLGDAKQYVSAYVEGTAPDVRRYPVSITVTAGVEVTLVYPAEAWMTAEDVDALFEGTLQPQLAAQLAGLIENHNNNQEAHPALRTKITEAKTAADAAKEAADAAQETADDAAQAAAQAQETADDAAQAAAQADGKADAAMEVATAAKQTADKAETDAADAMNSATAALEAITKLAHTIDTTPTQAGTLTYTGAVQSPAWNGYNEEAMTISGVTTGTDAGTYTATFTPKEGYTWKDGTATPRDVNWTIGRAPITTTPAQSGTLTYTGAALSPTWSNYDADKLTMGGTTTATNAGTYAATFTPKANYKWNDGETGARSANWVIGKAAGTLSLNKTTLALDVGTKTGTITVDRSGDGAISAKSSNTGVATVSVSGNIVTVTAAGKGSATITVSVGAGTNYTAPANKTCAVTVTLPTTTLNDNTWAVIKQVSDAGQGANYWSLGDTKKITINGTIGATAISNLDVDTFILGFNHNSTREGNNKIHFKIGKINGTPIALVDSKYGTNASSATAFNMNTSNTNSGGWNNSLMRKTILGNSNTPTAPLANSFMAALPADLRAVMKPVTKYSDNTGGGNDTASYVTATTDYLFLLSEWEYHGARTYANSAEKNYQAQYDYYKAGNSKVHYKHNATGDACGAWCRSVYASNTYYFCRVYTDGGAGSGTANISWGLAPGFCV